MADQAQHDLFGAPIAPTQPKRAQWYRARALLSVGWSPPVPDELRNALCTKHPSCLERGRTQAQCPFGRPAPSIGVDGYMLDGVDTLAVTPQYNGKRGNWTVTHLTSGQAILPFAALDIAKRALLELAPMTDWSKTHEQLFDDDALATRVKRLREAVTAGTV